MTQEIASPPGESREDAPSAGITLREELAALVFGAMAFAFQRHADYESVTMDHAFDRVDKWLATPHGASALSSLRREREEARELTSLIEWWDQHKMDGPSVGVTTDGKLGFYRGRITSATWVVRGRQFPALVEALRAARDAHVASAPSKEGSQ